MGTLRVTQGILVQRVLNNLAAQTRRLLDLQNQLSTGLRVNSPSDDPIDARRALSLRAAIGEHEQFLTNIDAAGPQLLETTTTVQSVIDILQRTREITLRGANGAQAPQQLDALAEEIDELLESVFEAANHQTNDRYIFAGTRSLTATFSATRDAAGEITAVTFNGNTEHFTIAVSDDMNVVVNETGDDIFLADEDIFQTLIDVRDNLRAGDQTSLQGSRLTELENAQRQLLRSLARVGSVQNRLDRIRFDTEEFITQFQETLSQTVEADIAEVIVNLNAQSNAFEAALAAAARVIQPSLLDYLR